MADLPVEFAESQHPDVARAALFITAWLRAKRLAESGELGACPSVEALAAFASGVPGAERLTPVFSHIAVCRRCRMGVDALLRSTGRSPLRVFHLPSLRHSAPQSAEGLRGWLVRVLESTRRLDISVESLDLLFSSLAGGFRILSPPAIDRDERFSVEVSVPAERAPASLLAAIEDHEQRLELCAVPISDGKASILADVHCLNPPAGPVPPSLLDLSLLSVEEASGWWRGPRILGTLSRLVESEMDSVDVFDTLMAITGAAPEQWRASLRSEIAALPDPASGVAVVQSILQSLNQFAATWRASNGSEHHRVAECVSALADLSQSTYRPRRRPSETQPSTVRPTGRKRSREVPELGEEH
jgi:hypothetical protein